MADGDRWRPGFPYRHPLLTAGLALALAGALLAGYLLWRAARDTSCAPGVEERRGECVGVTDGAHAFHEDMEEVSRLIEKENDWVERQRREHGEPYVTVAFARPMDLEGGGKGDIDAVVYGLKGAHAAQWRANRTSVRGNLPNIRLVVANFGEKGRHWLFTAEKLVEASRDGQRLVAVTGISRSTAQTAAALNHLSRHRIPQVSDVLTADRIKGDPMLARVAPTNSDQAAAAARWLRGQGVEKVQHVFDRNPDDAYAATLRTAFRTAFGSEGLREEGGAYNSALGDPANLFFAMDANLCGQRDTDTVYFSGRSGPLKEFVEQLGNRTCLERAFTVVTADDATLLLSDDEFDQALRRRIRVVYTGLAHPDVWKHATDSAVHPNTVEFFGDEGWFARTFQGTPLADGHVIMAHDAVLTAVCAIRLGGGQGSDVPRPEDVAQNLHALVGGREVPGASGYISLDERGFARDKAVPVLEIHPGGRITLLTPNPAADPASAPDGR